LFQTDRLSIRELSIEDLNEIHALLSLPESDRYNAFGIPDTIQVTKVIVNEWITEQSSHPRKSYIYSIAMLDTNQFIGLIALIPGKPKYKIAEVWFKIHIGYWGRGFMTEALAAVLHFAFEVLKLHRIEAGCAVENIASAKVLEKAGMTREGTKRRLLPKGDQWLDCYSYAILENEFLSTYS
jgi:RimJ/RimL family protein N-acetyltransferase